MAWYDWIVKNEKLNEGERWWVGNTGNLYKKLFGNGKQGTTKIFRKKPK